LVAPAWALGALRRPERQEPETLARAAGEAKAVQVLPALRVLRALLAPPVMRALPRVAAKLEAVPARARLRRSLGLESRA